MQRNRPRRLSGVAYIGPQRYSLTICTSYRIRAFTTAEDVEPARLLLLHTARRFDFAVVAFCFMPDHLHTLVEDTTPRSDLPEFVRRFKQLTSFHRQRAGQAVLWQPGYHERVLRSDEATHAVARYILENPIRAGITMRLGEYPFAGSGVYDASALAELWR